MKVMLTGGSGFLGSYIAERLQARAHTVRAMVRATSPTDRLRAAGVELCEGTLEDAGSLRAAVRGVDAVIHCAGLVKARSEEDFDRVNATGTRLILDAVLAENSDLRRFVQLSSIAARGPAGQGAPGRETAAPYSAYGASKLRGEQEALAEAGRLPVTVIRPPVIYGPRDVELLDLFRAVGLGVVPSPAPPGAQLSLVYGADCAAAVVQALEVEHPSGRIYYVDDGVAHTWRSLSAAVARALGRKRPPRLLPVPRFALLAAARASDLVGELRGEAVMFSTGKAREILEPDWVVGHEDIRRELGWQPEYDLERGLARTVAWYREEGWI